jgi:competence ComEA-like helix-hairpin-helix protein
LKRICILALISACWLWSEDGEGQRLPPGPGKEAVATVCAGCHSVTNIRQQRLSKEEWTSEIDQMVDHGATITDEQMPVILEYLITNFGTESKLRVNTAPAVEFRSILGLTPNEADAVVAYRDMNGEFHQLSDLQKVPKVEWKKIESKKDQLEF